MTLVDNDSFLNHLSKLFESSKEKGSIWLTHKRLSYGDDSTTSAEDREYPCLVRLTDGHKIQYSTHIISTDLSKFHAAYGGLLKSAMTANLRKRDKKREKLRAEESAKRKKRMSEEVVVDGVKRGNGRRKRQRKVKAAIKQAESKKKLKQREIAAAS